MIIFPVNLILERRVCNERMNPRWDRWSWSRIPRTSFNSRMMDKIQNSILMMVKSQAFVDGCHGRACVEYFPETSLCRWWSRGRSMSLANRCTPHPVDLLSPFRAISRPLKIIINSASFITDRSIITVLCFPVGVSLYGLTHPSPTPPTLPMGHPSPRRPFPRSFSVWSSHVPLINK